MAPGAARRCLAEVQARGRPPATRAAAWRATRCRRREGDRAEGRRQPASLDELSPAAVAERLLVRGLRCGRVLRMLGLRGHLHRLLCLYQSRSAAVLLLLLLLELRRGLVVAAGLRGALHILHLLTGGKARHRRCREPRSSTAAAVARRLLVVLRLLHWIVLVLLVLHGGAARGRPGRGHAGRRQVGAGPCRCTPARPRPSPRTHVTATAEPRKMSKRH